MNVFKFSKNSVYSDKFFIYHYNDDNIRIVHQKFCREKGFEEIKKDNYIPHVEKSEIDRVSLSRTRRSIRELALSNDFEYFATLTINSYYCDRFHLTECQELLRKKLKKLKRKNNEFAYIFITEKHKDRSIPFPWSYKTVLMIFIQTLTVIFLIHFLMKLASTVSQKLLITQKPVIIY